MTEMRAAPAGEKLFAKVPGGQDLPILDITNPAFAMSVDEAGLRRMKLENAAADASRGLLQRVIINVMLRLAARKSPIIRAIRGSRGSFMGGLSTYVLKLGPQNLVPPFDSRMDRMVAGSIAALSVRLRLEQVARLLADALRPALAAQPAAPLTLIDIAGGPAMDSLNTLILLRDQLAGRAVRVLVLDPDREGPGFGASALAALQTGPLAGLDITFEHRPVQWQDVGALEKLEAGGIAAATSEGGLFEYGTDAEIVAVLKALAGLGTFVGSVTRADPETRRLYASSKAKVIPRGIEGFAPLVKAAGWRIERVLEAPYSDQVLLRR